MPIEYNMDLSTIKKIERKVFTIYPDPGKELTIADIKVSNWMKKNDLTNNKIRISSFYLNNTTIPCFIPRFTDVISPLSVYTDLSTTTGSAGYIVNYNLLNVNTLGYRVAIKEKSSPFDIYVAYVYMDPAISEHPSNIPVSKPQTDYAQYTNNYYSFYDTSKFGEAVTASFKALFAAVSVPATAEIIKQGNGYELIVSKAVADVYDILIDDELAKLYKFKVDPSLDSSILKTVVFNTDPITYNSITCYSAPTIYTPDTWYPYDDLLFKTDATIETETFFTTSNYIAQDYDSVMLSYDMHTNDPDGRYNFLVSDIRPGSGWCTLRNSNNNENVSFSIFLKLRATGGLVPYTIGEGEIVKFVIEYIETY